MQVLLTLLLLQAPLGYEEKEQYSTPIVHTAAQTSAQTSAQTNTKVSPPPAQVQLLLHNGDVITGTLLHEDHQSLSLQTSYAGVLVIDRSALLRCTHNPVQHPTQQLTQQSPQQTKASPPAVANQLGDLNAVNTLNTTASASSNTTSSSTPSAVAQSDDTTLAPEWSLNIDLSASSRSGKAHSQSYSLSQQGEYQLKQWRYKFDSQYDYETKETARKTHKYQLSPGIDYFYAADLFWRFSLDYQYNYLASDYKNIDISTGPGFSVWHDEWSQFDLSLLGGSKKAYFRNEEILTSLSDFGSSITYDFGSIEWDYRQRWQTWPLELYSNGNYMKLLSQPLPLLHFEREYKAELGLRYLLSEHLRVSWGWQYERTDISLRLPGFPDIPLTVRDLRHKLSVGASF